jgi:predicted nuclease of predicted toxin-antitoxin system
LADEKLRFYLDENVPVEIARQLKSLGIDSITVRDLDLLGDSDENHLQRATVMGRVLCTHDSDYIQLASGGMAHAGIVFGQQDIHHIGAWVKALE